MRVCWVLDSFFSMSGSKKKRRHSPYILGKRSWNVKQNDIMLLFFSSSCETNLVFLAVWVQLHNKSQRELFLLESTTFNLYLFWIAFISDLFVWFFMCIQQRFCICCMWTSWTNEWLLWMIKFQMFVMVFERSKCDVPAWSNSASKYFRVFVQI